MACIGENTIGALFDNRLGKPEVDAIDAHVAECEDCRELLCGMARLYASNAASRVVAQTAELLGSGAATRSEGDANLKRLLALLGCERHVGRVLGGKWRLDNVLGVGGMAEVYSATHLSNGRHAAIKLLRPEWLSQPNVVYRFLREGYVANRIKHAGAVTILDDGTTEDGLPYLVLELIDGHPAAPHVRNLLPIATVLWIATEVLDVLAVAHDAQIIHRDIKPENILLTRQNTIKVLDFGIARTRETTKHDGATQQGMLMGTPSYMPPEQARGDNDAIDARTDVWAVGATMFALLAGRHVHVKGTATERLVAAMREPAPKLASAAPDIPREICALVDRALAFDPADRFQSAREMQEAIRALGQTRRADVRRRVGLALGGVVVLALVSSVAYVAHAQGALWPRPHVETIAATAPAATTPPVTPLPPPSAEPSAASGPTSVPPRGSTPSAADSGSRMTSPARTKSQRRAPPRKPDAPPAATPAPAPPPPAPPPPAPPESPLDRRD